VIDAGDRSVTTDEFLILDGNRSSDDRGIVTHAWDLGDGTRASGPVTTHAYSSPGIFKVTLTVTDADGLTDRATVEIAVNGRPVARFTQTPGQPAPGAPVQFDASSSTDDVGIAAHFWEFGDGSTASGEYANHSYLAEGNYTVELTVSDAEGAADSVSKTLQVSGPGGCTGGSVTVGTILSYSGMLGSIAKSIKQGAQVAVDHVNSGGCVQGKKLSLDVLGDDRLDGATAVQLYREMLLKGHKAVIGSMVSSITQQIVSANENEPAGLVVVSPASTAAVLTDPTGANPPQRFFRTIANDSVQGDAMAREVVSTLAKTKVGLLYQDEIYGQGVRAAFVPALNGRGGQVVSEAKFPPGTVSFAQEIDMVLAGNPELVVIASFYKEAAYIVGELKAKGFAGPILATQEFENYEIFSIQPAAKLEGVLFTKAAPEPGRPAYRKFVADYQSRFGTPPEAFADLGYDALTVAAEAMRAKGTGAAADQLADHLRSTVFTSTATRDVSFTPRGDLASGDYALWKVQGGKFAPYILKSIGVACVKYNATSYKCQVAAADAGVDFTLVGAELRTGGGSVVSRFAAPLGAGGENNSAAPPVFIGRQTDNGDGSFGVGDDFYFIPLAGQTLFGLKLWVEGGGASGSAPLA
jgi:ABC-type branched-subunit amino acid transport system substrate-binding protein